MTSLRSRLIGLAVLACLAGAALPAAADGPRDRGYQPSYWQGLYAGVHVGYGEADVLGIGLDGFAGGGLIGYNWQKGQIVYGWEADFSISDISFEVGPYEASVDWMATVRGRLGVLMHPDYLAYATAGFGIGHVDTNFGFDDTGTDFVFGLGVEGKLNQTSTVRAEYLNVGDIDVFRAALTFKLSGY
jgi:outer membrane immunogenic protein